MIQFHGRGETHPSAFVIAVRMRFEVGPERLCVRIHLPQLPESFPHSLFPLGIIQLEPAADIAPHDALIRHVFGPGFRKFLVFRIIELKIPEIQLEIISRIFFLDPRLLIIALLLPDTANRKGTPEVRDLFFQSGIQRRAQSSNPGDPQTELPAVMR